MGDASEVLESEVADGSVDLIFADPPYNIGKTFAQFVDNWPNDEKYAQWCYSWLNICIRKLAPHGSMYVMASTQSMPFLDLYLRGRMTILSRLCWHYDSSGVQAKRYYGSTYEPILFCVKDSKNYHFDAAAVSVEARTGSQRRLIDYRKPVPTLYSATKVPGNVWYFPRVRYRMPEYEEHPSQKPESLLERIVAASSKPQDLVLDPFAGTFTSCAVAQRLGRRFIGIEAQLAFVKVGLRRLGVQNSLDGDRLEAVAKNFKRTVRKRPGPRLI